MRQKSGWLLVILVIAGCNLTTARPTPTPPLAPQPPTLDVPPPQAFPNENTTPINPNCPATPSNWITYTIEPGDSLSLLADQTNSTVQELTDGNCLANPDQINVGDIIFLPAVPAESP